MSWNTIESDPGVFSELLGKWGVQSAKKFGMMELSEVWDLSSLGESGTTPAAGLILLFKHEGKEARTALSYYDGPEVFFARQVINNACASQALLHIVLNAHGMVSPGEMLSNFHSFAAGLPADMRGAVMEQQDEIRTAHNSFARAEPFAVEEPADDQEGEAFHFVAYVPSSTRVLELDGLQKGPVDLGAKPDGARWETVIAAEVQRRVATYAAAEIRFALLAVTPSKRSAWAVRREVLAARLAAVDAAVGAGLGEAGAAAGQAALGGSGRSTEAAALAAGEDCVVDLAFGGDTAAGLEPLQRHWALPTTLAAAGEVRAGIEAELGVTESQLAAEEARWTAWEEENARRRHNFVPFLVELCRQLARKGELAGLREAGTAKHQAKVQQAVERRLAAGGGGGGAQ